MSDYDSDGVRENEETRRSNVRRLATQRAEEAAAADARTRRQDDVLESLRTGAISMADFAKAAREAGLTTGEVAKALRAAQVAKAEAIDMAAVSRGDAEAALRGVSARAVPAPAKTPARVAPAKPTGTAKASPAAPALAIGGGGGGGGGAALDSTRAPAAAADAAASREHAYLELSVGGEARGRLVAELFGDLVPRTAANFAALCAGASVAGRRLSYEGCAFHRLVRGFVLQGGDVISGDGSGAACIHDDRVPGTFPDERLDLPHSRPGLLSMANMGRDSNGCQFFVTLQPAPQLDGKHVVFGRLVAGMALLRQLEEMPTDATERPATPIVITRCGALSRAEALAATAAEGGASASVEYGGGLARPGERARGAEAGRERAERAAALDLGGEALVLAAAKGDVHMLRSLVASGVPIDAYGTVQGEGGGGAVECCALHVAARAGDAATLSALLAGGADAGLRDSRGSGALHLAVLAGSAPCARLLLGVGCPQHELDGDGRAPVHAAVAAGALQVLQVLLDADASVASLPCASLLPVHVAAAADQGSAVRLLASARADLDVLATSEHAPLHLAAAAGGRGAVAALVECGASLSVRGERSGKTPLHCACERGRLAVARALLGAGAAVGETDASGATALHWASRAGASDVAAALLEAGATVDAVSRGGSRPLHLACEAAAGELVSLLLARGASALAPDASGVAPLHAAAASGCEEAVEALLAAGAPVEAELEIRGMEALSNATEGHTKRPLFLAAEKGHAAVVRRLLATGADANAVATVAGSGAVSRLSPLWAARRGGHAEAEAALVAAGAVEVAEMQPLPPSLDDSGSGAGERGDEASVRALESLSVDGSVGEGPLPAGGLLL